MVKKGAALIFDSAPPAAYNRGHESGPAGFWGPEPAFPLPLWRGSAAAVARWAPNFNRRGKIQVKHMNTKQNAAKRILSRAWGKAPVKRLTALLVMLAVTIGSVTTVMASVKPVSVTYNGEVYSGNTTASIETVEDARAQLLSMGLAVHDDDAVTLSSGEEGEPVITLVSAHKVSVLADGMLKETTVYEGDPISKALGQCGVVVDANDILSAPVTTSVTADTVFEVERRYEVTITADGKTKKLLTGDGTVGELLEEEGIEVGADDILTPDPETAITEGTAIQVQRVTYEEVTAEEAIPYTVNETKDASLPRGVTKVDVQGQDGLQTVTRRNKLVDGEVAESTVLSTTVTKEPVAQQSRVGTKDPNGWATIESDGTVYDANGNEVKYTKLLTGRCSAYTGGGTTATGLPAAFGRVAVNPNVIPYGTKLYICSPDGKVVYGYAVAADTGGACMRNSIIADLYYDSYNQCFQIGVRNMNVYILG